MATVKKPAPPAAAQAPEAPARPAKKSARKKLLIPVIALLIASGGGGGWFYLQQKQAQAKSASAPAAEKKKPPVFLPIEQFTVNLSGGGGDRFLQISFTLQVAEPAIVDELKLQMPVVRSRLLLLLASRTADELGTSAGKQKLVGDLLAEARAPLAKNELPGKGIDNLHFSAFVIQ